MEKTYHKQIKWEEPNTGEGVIITISVILNQRQGDKAAHTIICYSNKPQIKTSNTRTSSEIDQSGGIDVAINEILRELQSQISSFYRKDESESVYEDWLINDGYSTAQGLKIEIPDRKK